MGTVPRSFSALIIAVEKKSERGHPHESEKIPSVAFSLLSPARSCDDPVEATEWTAVLHEHEQCSDSEMGTVLL